VGHAWCEVHELEKRADFDRKRGNRNDIYDYEWKKFRIVYIKEHPYCIQCGEPTYAVDHIVPLSKGGGKYDLNNLQPLCLRCHSMKTTSEDGGGWR
jgi:5-methylcytosine-specific restriction protein A